MAQRNASMERPSYFPDAVFTVIITIMVLDLKPPELATSAALLSLWPTALAIL